MSKQYKEIWVEDECTRHTDGHENWRDAFKRLLEKDPPTGDLFDIALEVQDNGDSCSYLLEGGVLVIHSFDGFSISVSEPR